jgi:hypothetical protein
MRKDNLTVALGHESENHFIIANEDGNDMDVDENIPTQRMKMSSSGSHY